MLIKLIVILGHLKVFIFPVSGKSCLNCCCQISPILPTEIRCVVIPVSVFVCTMWLPPLSGPFTVRPRIILTASTLLTTCSGSKALGTSAPMSNPTSAWIVGIVISFRVPLNGCRPSCWCVCQSQCIFSTTESFTIVWNEMLTMRPFMFTWFVSKRSWATWIQKRVRCHCPPLDLDTHRNDQKTQSYLLAPVTPNVSAVFTSALDTDCCSQLSFVDSSFESLFVFMQQRGMQSRVFLTLKLLFAAATHMNML